MKKFTPFFIALSCLMLTSCVLPTNCIFTYRERQFALDSCKIREGKYSVLSMANKGHCCGCVTEDMLREKEVIENGDFLTISAQFTTPKEGCVDVESFNKVSDGLQVTNGEIKLLGLSCVQVEGLTLEEARQEIQEGLREIYGDVDVNVSFKDKPIGSVTLLGNISASSLPVTPSTRLYDILSQGKLNSSVNYFSSYILRDCKKLPVDMYKLVYEGDMCQNILIKPDDKIFLGFPSDFPIVVLGEVGSPSPINVPNGFMSLPEVLAQGRGILTATGSYYRIRVYRTSFCPPRIYTLYWCNVARMPRELTLCIPGDIVFVGEKAITRWNRNITQIIPTFQLVDLIDRILK